METFITDFNIISAVGAIIFFIAGIIILVLALFAKEEGNDIYAWLKKNALLGGFIVAWLSVIGSLIYSNGIGYAPCELCWTLRIFIYSQAVLYTIALIKKDRAVFKYALWLSVLGLIVSLYHNWIMLGGTDFVACSSVGASCTMIYVNEFGFITIPFMGLSSILFLLGISALAIKDK